MSVFLSFTGEGEQPKQNKSRLALGGDMDFAFIDMGQGDCTIISLPDDSIIIFDCGYTRKSKAEKNNFGQAKDVLKAWNKKAKTITLIISHSDIDHYRAFFSLLKKTNGYRPVAKIYFSEAASDDAPLSNYGDFANVYNLGLLGHPPIMEVTINNAVYKTKQWTLQSGDYKLDGAAVKLDVPLKEVAKGTAKGIDWSVNIIAGNVKETKPVSVSEANNSVSLVALFVYGSQKMLLNGDATAATLAFVLSKHKPRIADTTIFHIPHHGSDGSIPTDEFRRVVDPKSLVLSCGVRATVHFHPRKDVTDFWLGSPHLEDVSRTYDCWTDKDIDRYPKPKDLTKIVEDWNSKKWKVEHNKFATFHYLLKPQLAKKEFYGVSNRFMFLYRMPTEKNLFQTAVEGNLINDGFQNPDEESRNEI